MLGLTDKLTYTWPEFYDHAVDLTRYALSGTMVRRRFLANRGISTRFLMHDQNAYLRNRGETPPARHRELRWRAAE